MEQNEKNSGLTPFLTKYENTELAASQLAQSLIGQRGIKVSERLLYESILEYLKQTKRFSSMLQANGFVILTSKENSLRQLLRLHKNKRSLIIAFEPSPTNNNTHASAAEVETP